jgi:hypothetical protein
MNAESLLLVEEGQPTGMCSHTKKDSVMQLMFDVSQLRHQHGRTNGAGEIRRRGES